MYEIEKGIPITHAVHRGNTKRKYPFDDMGVGDSFFVKCKKEDRKKVASTLSNSTRRMPDKRFTTRFINEEKTGIRIWRVS